MRSQPGLLRPCPRTEAERHRALYENQRKVSPRALQEAQASDHANEATAHAAELELLDIEASTAQQFGRTVARRAFDPGSAVFRRRLARSDALVRATMPPALGKQSRASGIDFQAGVSGRVRGSLSSQGPEGRC